MYEYRRSEAVWFDSVIVKRKGTSYKPIQIAEITA